MATVLKISTASTVIDSRARGLSTRQLAAFTFVRAVRVLEIGDSQPVETTIGNRGSAPTVPAARDSEGADREGSADA